MAYTATTIDKTVFGNKRVTALNVTADALSGSVGGIMGVVSWVEFAPISMATAGIQIYINQNAAGTTTNGTVKISGCTAGDNFYLTVYGR